jgi:hypothetical protein
MLIFYILIKIIMLEKLFSDILPISHTPLTSIAASIVAHG